jgi:hypothetical protein
MDDVTQQNAALVEEAAAAAASLAEQVMRLSQTISVFRLGVQDSQEMRNIVEIKHEPARHLLPAQKKAALPFARRAAITA